MDDLLIRVNAMEHGGWECDVEIRGENVGGGTGLDVSSAIDVAMDILYGTKNDWLNGNHGVLERLTA